MDYDDDDDDGIEVYPSSRTRVRYDVQPAVRVISFDYC